MKFAHKAIASPNVRLHWEKLKKTVSKEKAYQATVAIGELAAEDMLDFSGKTPSEIDRIYVKLRDGMPMAAGIKRKLPHVDIRYIVSQLKQGSGLNHPPIFFWDGYDGYSNENLWFADPINATGYTAIESLRFVRWHFEFSTALISHVVANIQGIKRMQTTLEDFSVDGFMNYAYLSTRMNRFTGYLTDGLELIPDFGDKVGGTLGEDYSIYEIQKDLRMLIGTELGKVELMKGTILHLIQIANADIYPTDRRASWITKNWVSAALRWYCEVGELPFKNMEWEQTSTLIDDLCKRDFLLIEKRPWKRGFAYVYSLTEDGVNYASKVYLPVLHELGIPQKLQKHFDFLIHLLPREIEKTIADVM